MLLLDIMVENYIKEHTMDIKKKINELKKRSIQIATLAATLFPAQSSLPAPYANSGMNNDKKDVSHSILETRSSSDILNEEVNLKISELKDLLNNNPNIQLSADFLDAIQPGPSQQKMRSILEKGFDFTIRNSRGENKNVHCSLNQTPKGYCSGAIKRLLNKVYKEPISGNLSAYQEKDNLLQSPNFMALAIELKDVINCPINTVVVIPKCKGHKHGHIFTVVDKGVYCSDGKEVAGDYFENNYKTAKGIYAFVPVDGSIKLTPNLLQKSPELYAAVLNQKIDKEVLPLTDGKTGQPILLAEINASRKHSSFNR